MILSYVKISKSDCDWDVNLHEHKHTGVNPFQPSLARDLSQTGCCQSNLM